MSGETNTSMGADARALIERSSLLSDARKRELLTALPSLGEARLRRLVQILQSEDRVLQDIAKRAIERAVETKNVAFLEELDAFLTASLKKLRKAEEGAERGSDAEDAEHLFDEST